MVSAVVITQGCNFSCPYCHNPALVAHGSGNVEEAALLQFLKGRKRLLDGVVISGGEPTLQTDLPDFCAELKAMGFAVKLDTNGSKPQMLRRLLDMALLDYVALDVKADPAHYPHAISPAPLAGAIGESIKLLGASGIACEFRTTCVAPFVTRSTVAGIAQAVGSIGPLFLQRARLDGVLNPQFFTDQGIQAPAQQTMQDLQQTAVSHGADCRIR